MSSNQALTVALGLADWSAKTGLVFLVVSAACRILRPAPAAARLLWAATFAAVIALPILSAIFGGRVGLVRLADVENVTASPVALPTAPLMSPLSVSVPSLLVLIWLLGVSALTANSAIGFVALYRMTKRSRNWEPEGVDLTDLSARSGVSRPWQLRITIKDHPFTAATWGWRHPVVLVPKAAEEWDSERLDSILLHELAHVRRMDPPLQLVARAVAALQWFNPLVWLAEAALRKEAEAAADEAVLAAGVRGSTYAQVLLQTVAEFRSRRTAYRSVTVPFLRQGELERRITSILSPRPSVIRPTSRQKLLIALASFGLVGGMASVRIAVAQDSGSSLPLQMSEEFWSGYRAGSTYNHRQKGRSSPPATRAEAAEAFRKWQAQAMGPRSDAERRDLERRLRDRLPR